jgi:hypothetical protein
MAFPIPPSTPVRLFRLLIATLLSLPFPALAQDAAPATDTPETLAAMHALLPPLPAEIPHWDALPAETRAALADLRIEMHRWHADPAQRFVMMAGRRIEEGGVIGQELWLREVRPDGVVLQYRNLIFQRPR